MKRASARKTKIPATAIAPVTSGGAERAGAEVALEIAIAGAAGVADEEDRRQVGAGGDEQDAGQDRDGVEPARHRVALRRCRAAPGRRRSRRRRCP